MKFKRLIWIAFAVMLMVVMIPKTEIEAEAATTLTLSQLRQKFPRDKYWNHAGNPGASNSVNNQDGYTTTPCSQHGVVGTDKQTCNGFQPGSQQLSWQCMGYAEKLGYDATGYNPRVNANGWYTYTSSSALDNLKPGDIVRYKNDGHSIYVIGVNGDTVTYTDCNSDNQCIIRWDETISKSTLKSTFTHVRSAPFALDGGSSAPLHTVDTSYGTNFTAYPKAKITAENIMNAYHGQLDNGSYIDATDKCTIVEVYTDGCCKVTYPLYTGGTKTVYSYISLFNVTKPTIKHWLSDTEYGTTPSEFIVGNKYYYCYRIYDAISGKNWDEVENSNYTVNLTFYNPDGSVKYTNQKVFNYDQSWISSVFKEPGTYTVKIVVSGDYTLERTNTFTVKDNPKKVNSSINTVSLNLSGTKSQTIYFWSTGYYSGNAVWDWSISNSNISYSWGEWTDDNRLPLTINAQKPGTTNLTISLKDKGTGAVIDSKIIPVTVGVNTTAIRRNTTNNAVISTGGEMKYFTYTALADVQYVIYSTGSEDTKVYLYDSDWNELDSNDDGGAGTNFRLEYDLTPGRDYIFGIKYYNSSKTGTIPFKFGNVFTVSYDANGGSGAPSAQNRDYGTDITLSSTVPTRAGYTFLGWSTSSTATIAIYQPGDSFTTDANTTLYAVWRRNTYTISYNANGGSGAPSAQNIEYGSFLILSSTVPTRTGYTFLGWSISSTATTATYQPRDSFTTDKDTTFYAVWKLNTYTISYNANGGTGAPDSQIKTYGSYLTLSSTVPIRTGYTFLGWSTSSTATTATYQPGDTYISNANTTLYAVWKQNTYTISYNPNGGTGAPGNQTKSYGVNLTLSNTVPTRIGYTFLGWSTSSTATSATYQPGDTYTSNANTTLYAVWKLNTYTISYNANGGTGAPGSQTKIHGVNLTLSNTVPTRTGYTFLGWSTNSTATTATYQPGGNFTIDADTTFYAVWKKGCANDTHTYSYQVTKTPTVSAQGTLTGTCSACSASVTIILPKLNTDDYIYEVTKAPDCTNFGAGMYTWKNTSYGSTYYFSPVLIPPTGHTYGDWYTSQYPTCTGAGEKRRDCNNCDHYETDVVAAIGHSHTTVVTEPTCTNKGYTTYTCSCGDSYTSNYVNALGHSFTNYVSNNDATCTVDGTKTAKCDNGCGKTDTVADAYSATGHNYTEIVTKPTCYDKGYTTYVCHCGYSYVINYIDALGHTFTYYSSNNDATCTTDGTKTAKCNHGCGKTNTITDAGSAKGHSYGNWYETKSPTCTEVGEERRDCNNCDHYETDVVAATGHSHTAAVTKPTCLDKGYTTYTCHCGDSYVSDCVNALGHSFTNYISDGNATTEADGTKTALCDRNCGAKDTVTDVGSKIEVSDITSDKYTVSGGFIQGISINTTVNGLVSSVNESEFVKVVDKNGNAVSGTTILGTGMKVQLVSGGKVIKEVIVVVTGDTNGDGKITVTDMIAVKSHLLNKSALSGAAAKAGDANNDNGISITDFIRIKAHILGKSSVAGTTKSVGEPVASVVNAETVETEPQNTEQYIDSNTETMYYLNVEKFYLPEVKYSSGSYLNK